MSYMDPRILLVYCTCDMTPQISKDSQVWLQPGEMKDAAEM